jgi:hypothetical protein
MKEDGVATVIEHDVSDASTNGIIVAPDHRTHNTHPVVVVFDVVVSKRCSHFL